MSRCRLTPSGRFEVTGKAGSLGLRHVPTGLRCGGFSHLAVKTIRVALIGVASAESTLTTGDFELIDDAQADWEVRKHALRRWEDAMVKAFPNGAWSR